MGGSNGKHSLSIFAEVKNLHRDLRSSEILRSVDWWLLTDIWGRHIWSHLGFLGPWWWNDKVYPKLLQGIR